MAASAAVKVALLGATKGIGRALARLLVSRGHDVFVLGMPLDDLERTARDLEVRADPGSSGTPRPVGTALCDLRDRSTFAPALDAAEAALGGLDTVIVTAGAFGTQDQLESDAALLELVLDVNFTGTILFCEQVKRRLLARGGGTLAVFSSVAGDRGRKPVALYGATKAGLSHYLESLDHKHRADGLVTLTVKPGFVKTGMTAGLKPPPFAGEPDGVAADVLRAIERRRAVVYTPWPWYWVMLVIRNLPRFVMRKINF